LSYERAAAPGEIGRLDEAMRNPDRRRFLTCSRLIAPGRKTTFWFGDAHRPRRYRRWPASSVLTREGARGRVRCAPLAGVGGRMRNDARRCRHSRRSRSRSPRQAANLRVPPWRDISDAPRSCSRADDPPFLWPHRWRVSGTDAVGASCRHGFADRNVIQHRCQPALRFSAMLQAFSRGVVFHLVAFDLADAEIETFRDG